VQCWRWLFGNTTPISLVSCRYVLAVDQTVPAHRLRSSRFDQKSSRFDHILRFDQPPSRFDQKWSAGTSSRSTRQTPHSRATRRLPSSGNLFTAFYRVQPCAIQGHLANKKLLTVCSSYRLPSSGSLNPKPVSHERDTPVDGEYSPSAQLGFPKP